MSFITSDRNLLGNCPLLMNAKDLFEDTWRIGKKGRDFDLHSQIISCVAFQALNKF